MSFHRIVASSNVLSNLFPEAFMGLLDGVLGQAAAQVAGRLSSDQQQGMLAAVVNMINAQQLSGVLGSDQIGQAAAGLGVSSEDFGVHLSRLLPGVVDHLTPNGSLPQGGQVDLAGPVMSMLKGKLFG
jgi:uncharacterized protein YidB (DUF937 family)